MLELLTVNILLFHLKYEFCLIILNNEPMNQPGKKQQLPSKFYEILCPKIQGIQTSNIKNLASEPIQNNLRNSVSSAISFKNETRFEIRYTNISAIKESFNF